MRHFGIIKMSRNGLNLAGSHMNCSQKLMNGTTHTYGMNVKSKLFSCFLSYFKFAGTLSTIPSQGTLLLGYFSKLTSKEQASLQFIVHVYQNSNFSLILSLLHTANFRAKWQNVYPECRLMS